MCRSEAPRSSTAISSGVRCTPSSGSSASPVALRRGSAAVDGGPAAAAGDVAAWAGIPGRSPAAITDGVGARVAGVAAGTNGDAVFGAGVTINGRGAGGAPYRGRTPPVQSAPDGRRRDQTPRLLPPHRLSPGGSGDGIGRSQRPLEPPMHVDHVWVSPGSPPWTGGLKNLTAPLMDAPSGCPRELAMLLATGAAAASGSATARPSPAAARWLISSSIRVRLRSSELRGGRLAWVSA